MENRSVGNRRRVHRKPASDAGVLHALQAPVFADIHPQGVGDRLAAVQLPDFLKPSDQLRVADTRLVEVLVPAGQVGHGREQAGRPHGAVGEDRVLVLAFPGRAVRMGPPRRRSLRGRSRIRVFRHPERLEDALLAECPERLPGTRARRRARPACTPCCCRVQFPGLKFNSRCRQTRRKMSSSVMTSLIRQPARVKQAPPRSRRPLVCWSKCRMVIVVPKSCNSGKVFADVVVQR